MANLGAQVGSYGSFIPLFEASGKLHIQFTRNPDSYPLNKYSGMQVVPQPRGNYLYLPPEDATRVRLDYEWPLNQPRPKNNGGLPQFEVREFSTKRYSTDTALSTHNLEWTNWDLQNTIVGRLARQLAVNRTIKTIEVMTTTANYPSANVTTSAAILGSGNGVVYSGTTADPRFFKILQRASRTILAATDGTVGRMEDLTVVMSYNTASKLAESREIREYLMQSPFASGMITGDANGLMERGNAGLPAKLYKSNIVVEDTFANVGNPDRTSDVSTIRFNDDYLWIGVRSGDLTKEYNSGGTFDTLTQFVYQDMQAGTFIDDYNKLSMFTVEDWFDVKVTAGVTGYIVSALATAG